MSTRPALSFVIPVYNGATSIARVVEEIRELYADLRIEIVLVNDGSPDASEPACRELQEKYPDTVTFLHLSRNFGEHNAVLAGLNYTTGEYAVILDDDGQNPPTEVRKLYNEAVRGDFDAVYGKYRVKQHSLFRNLGSQFNDRVANIMLQKPPELYLSSFKILNRFLIEEITRYGGAFPYIDGLILRSTHSLGQVEVEHAERSDSSSNYTLRKLVRLWLNMFLNFSIKPLRLASLLGSCSAGVSILLLVAIVLDKLYFGSGVPVGLPTVLITIVFFAGIQLIILGTIGEYLGRLFLDHSKHPQFVVRYAQKRKQETNVQPVRSNSAQTR